MTIPGDARPLVVHLTTVHGSSDTRIFRKEARTIASNGYRVALLVPHQSHATVDGVEMVPISRPNHRLGRMVIGAARAYRLARRMPASIYHIHDPELLLAGWCLAKSGRVVLYDAHEDTPAQILDKDWIPKPLRRIVAWAFDRIERRLTRSFAGVITATEKIAERFPGAAVVHNYPDLASFPAPSPRATASEVRVVYVGGLTRARGAVQMVRAMGAVRSADVVLEIVGAVRPTPLVDELRGVAGFARVRLHGHLPWDAAWNFVADHGDIGLLLFQPAKNHVEALPTKLFEYMASGLPVIASDFPLWRRILEESGAGLVVDPGDPQAIATAIDRLVADPALRRAMGERARTAAVERYNWRTEGERLLRVYREALHADH
jgi:glycosyltransferase involved in cell wall biosynthesis